MIERMNRGRIVISSIDRHISRALRRMLGGTALPVLLATSVPAFSETAPATAVDPDPTPAIAVPDIAQPETATPDPFAAAASAPAAALALPNRRDASGASIEDILEELDPDLDQIEA